VRRKPRRIYHRGRSGRFSLFDWIRLIGMGGALVAFVGYLVWIYVLQPAAAPVQGHIWLPVVMR
jgi:hypothetical protein